MNSMHAKKQQSNGLNTSFFADEDVGFLGKNLSRSLVLYEMVGANDGVDLELGDPEGPRLRDNVIPEVGFIVGFPVGTLVGPTVNCNVGVDVSGLCGWGVGLLDGLYVGVKLVGLSVGRDGWDVGLDVVGFELGLVELGLYVGDAVITE
jgi:hypothetical protein